MSEMYCRCHFGFERHNLYDQLKETEVNHSIVDAISVLKGTTIMTSCNDCNKKVRSQVRFQVRTQVAKRNNLENQSDKPFELLHQI